MKVTQTADQLVIKQGGGLFFLITGVVLSIGTLLYVVMPRNDSPLWAALIIGLGALFCFRNAKNLTYTLDKSTKKMQIIKNYFIKKTVQSIDLVDIEKLRVDWNGNMSLALKGNKELFFEVNLFSKFYASHYTVALFFYLRYLKNVKYGEKIAEFLDIPLEKYRYTRGSPRTFSIVSELLSFFVLALLAVFVGKIDLDAGRKSGPFFIGLGVLVFLQGCYWSFLILKGAPRTTNDTAP